MDEKILDCVVIGGSAAGTAAGIYLARRGMDFKLITEIWGGEVATSGEIENWPGIKHTTGLELSEAFKEHLADYKVIPEEEVRVEKVAQRQDKVFVIKAVRRGQALDYLAYTVIIATGVHPRPLKVSREKELYHKGLSYCTTCDGPLFKGKITATIGGGNSALESALMLGRIAKKEYLININPQFKGDATLIKKVEQASNVEIIYNAKTTKILGDRQVTGIEYLDQKHGTLKRLEVEGVFVHIGMVPNSGLVGEELVEKNSYGEIITDKLTRTKTPGLFVAGDVSDIPYKQIVISGGQGAVAALEAVSYLNKLKI
jgi:alkyl hydroperoxide reductase subunit AhpF